MTKPSLLLYEPNVGGHRGEHLAWLAHAWRDQARPGGLVIVAPQGLVDDHPELTEVSDASGGTIRLAPFTEPPNPGTPLDSLFNVRRARPLARVLREFEPERALMMSFDHFLSPLALGATLPGRLAGITFRPTLHYAEIGSPPDSARERAERAIKRKWIRRALHHPSFDTLFSLDPAAVPALSALGGARVLPLLDPAPEEPLLRSPEAVRSDLGIEPGRRLFLLAGALDARKGPLAVLRALPEVKAPDRVAVALVGRVPDDIRQEVEALMAQIEARGGPQVVVRDGFVPAGELQTLLSAADVILVPYLRHVGSSGFILRAAGAGVPVLSQAWGAMGHVVRQRRLGQTVHPENAAALASAIERAAADPSVGFDAASATAFAKASTVDGFTRTLLDALAPLS